MGMVISPATIIFVYLLKGLLVVLKYGLPVLLVYGLVQEVRIRFKTRRDSLPRGSEGPPEEASSQGSRGRCGEADPRCIRCQQLLDPCEFVIRCVRCDAPHHEACWEGHPKCARQDCYLDRPPGANSPVDSIPMTPSQTGILILMGILILIVLEVLIRLWAPNLLNLPKLF